MRPRFRIYVQAAVFSLSALLFCPPGLAKTVVEYRTPYRDATVFRDVNSNRSFDEGEPSTISRIDGSFAPPTGKGRLYVQGGTHVLTGQANSALLTAPPKVRVINTLSSLFQALLDKGLAPTKAKKLLGIPSGVSLEEASAATGAQADSPKQRKLLQADGKNDTLAQFGKALANARLGLRPSLAASGSELIDLAATALLNLGQESVDLTDPAILQTVLADISSGLGRTASSDQLNAAAQAGSAINQQIDAQSDKLDSLTIVTANAARELAANDLQAVLSQYTAAGLKKQLDGRFLAYSSISSSLVAGDANEQQDVFAYDNVTGQTELVSLASDGTQGNGQSYSPAITPDGRYVAFLSDATNLVTGDTNNVTDLFLRDRNSGNTTRISVSTGGLEANGPVVGPPTFSDSGQYIAFASRAENLTDVAPNGFSNIFLRDTTKNTTQQISRGESGAAPNGDSVAPALSSDGRYLAFESKANNLVRRDKNEQRDIFLFDIDKQSTELVSVSSNGKQSNGYSTNPAIFIENGQVSVLFISHGDNLVKNDNNCAGDIFLRRLSDSKTEKLSNADRFLQFLNSTKPRYVSTNRTDTVYYLLGAAYEISSNSQTPTYLFSTNKSINKLFQASGSNGFDALANFSAALNAFGTRTCPDRFENGPSAQSRSNRLDDNTSAPMFQLTSSRADGIKFLVTAYTHKGNLSVFEVTANSKNIRNISIGSTGRPAKLDSYGGIISGNGQYAAFLSDDLRLINKRAPKKKVGVNEIFLRDLNANQTIQVSNDGASSKLNITLSNDAAFLAYQSIDKEKDWLFLFDKNTGSTRLISTEQALGLLNPRAWLTQDGSTLIYKERGTSTTRILALDIKSSETTTALDAGTNAEFLELEDVTPDGNLILFSSTLDSLVEGDTNEMEDLFLLNRTDRSIRRISVTTQNGQANGASYSAKMSADGNNIVFVSDASNLVFGDNNLSSDLYLHDMETGETRIISSP